MQKRMYEKEGKGRRRAREDEEGRRGSRGKDGKGYIKEGMR